MLTWWDLPVPTRLRTKLQEFRAAGASFDDAWRRAVPVVGHSGLVEWSAWMEVFYETREAWRRAYEGGPLARAELAVSALAPAIVGELDGEDLTRRCEWCDEPLPAQKDEQARYCCREHRRAAAYAREIAIADQRNPPVGDRQEGVPGGMQRVGNTTSLTEAA
jgi:hypothetical protein